MNNKDMSIAKKLLKHRKSIFEELYAKENSLQLSLTLLLISFSGIFIYGVAMGTYHAEPLLWLGMGLKLLLVLFGSTLLAVPALFTILSMRGSNNSFVQVITLIIGALATSGLIMLSLVPIVWFFTLSTQGITVLIFMNMFLIGFSVLFGLAFLVQGVNYEHRESTTLQKTGASFVLFLWLFLVFIVSLQMVYNLRPFFHEGNGYVKITLEEETDLDEISTFASSRSLPLLCGEGDEFCTGGGFYSQERTEYIDNGIDHSILVDESPDGTRVYFYSQMPFNEVESHFKQRMEKMKEVEEVEFVNRSEISTNRYTAERIF